MPPQAQISWPRGIIFMTLETLSNSYTPAQRSHRAPSPPPPPPPPVFPWSFCDLQHEIKYESLFVKPIVSTKFVNEYTLQILSLDADVADYLQCVNWTRFAYLGALTYCEITLEFLSILTSTVYIWMGREHWSGYHT